jgi:hypothetical protein
MNLSLLNPWFLLGALAVAAPLWLHLRRKPPKNLWRFSTLRFLDDSPHPRGSPLRLQDLVLCALRVLALLLVVTAFAWPYMRDAEQAVVSESRVYILDNTLSHQAADRFIRDRDRIAEEIDQAGTGVQVAVIELTGQPQVRVAFGDDREESRHQVKSLVPSFQRGSYLAAFRQANNMLDNSLGERKRIIFRGDNQENQWTEDANTPPFLHHVEIDLPIPDTTEAPNLALAEPRLRRTFLGETSLVDFTVKLVHLGTAPSATVTLQANDQVIFSRRVDLRQQPEIITLQAQWEADPGLWLRGVVSVEGEPDLLAADNRAFFSLGPVREGQVALLARSPYLRAALSPEVMRGHWATRVLDPAKLAGEIAANHDAEVLVVENGCVQSADGRDLVLRYLADGRGVILLVNRVTPAGSTLLRDLGFESAGPPAAGAPPDERFQYYRANHPIFHPFLSPDYGNLLDISVRQSQRLKTSQGVPLIFSESGDAVFFQGTGFRGRLYVAAFGFEREQTTWPTHATFIPFLDLCLQNARPEDSNPTDLEPGAVSVLKFPADSPVRNVVLRDGQQTMRSVPVVHGKAEVRLPDQPGLYTMSHDTSVEPEMIFSVNPPLKESWLRYVESPETAKLWQFDERSPEPARARAPASMSRAAILQQQIWWWLVLAGLAALLGETIWTSARKDLA